MSTSSSSAGSPEYSAADLGDFGPTCQTEPKGFPNHDSGANDVNNAGIVVGWSRYYDCDSSFWAGMTVDGKLSMILRSGFSGRNAEAIAVNDNGTVVGWGFQGILEGSRAFLYRDGVSTDLGTLCGGGCSLEAVSSAADINSSGQIAGTSSTGTPAAIGPQHAFLYDGVMRDLGTLGGPGSEAHGINDSGAVVGAADTGSGTHAFLWSGSMTDLGTLGGSSSVATAINEHGQVAGFSTTAGGSTHAFLRDSGQLADLGTLGGSWSKAYAINAFGQVVGVSATAGDAAVHVFTYADGVMQDIQDLVPAGVDFFAGPRLPGLGINNRGQIAGNSTCRVAPCTGKPHAFLLTDTTQPRCVLTATSIDDHGRNVMRIEVSDRGSGLAGIRIVGLSNGTAAVQQFAVGTPRAVVVLVTQQSARRRSSVDLTAGDVGQNTASCSFESS